MKKDGNDIGSAGGAAMALVINTVSSPFSSELAKIQSNNPTQIAFFKGHLTYYTSSEASIRQWTSERCRYGASRAVARPRVHFIINELFPWMETRLANKRAIQIITKASSGEAVGEASAVRKPNLNEYMVTLEKPIGIRFVQTLDGQIYVQALAKRGNAANSGMILVGDILKKASAESGDALLDVDDLSQTMHAIKSRSGPVRLILERSSHPISLRSLTISTNKEMMYNPDKGFGNPSAGQDELDSNFSSRPEYAVKGERETTELPSKIIAMHSDEQPGVEVEWTHGNFSLQEYSSAMSRAANDLCYNHRLGMNFTKITEHVYVGSCLQDKADLDKLQNRGVAAILNLQTPSEQANWEIDGKSIDSAAKEKGLLIVSCPIRDVDTVDLRRKLPFAVGILYRLLRKGYRVYVTCTTGLDRAPACVIAYLHWLQDVTFEEAVDFITNMHPCGPDRPALVWATWDLIAMAEKGNHKGPPTHAVQFVWNHGCKEGEDVLLVGDFKGGWDEPIRATHVSAQKYIVDLRLPQGKYHYKFIVGGHWQHSKSLPTEVDKWGNINNVIKIDDVASTRFDTPFRHPTKISHIHSKGMLVDGAHCNQSLRCT
ncbi:hypothetical protein O6H91_19G059000 [Diphasiastrum complanatum]|uniref:Uncharacterized protein n=1 Tax=Diphasiastrum complanatum TaxID=34168 RepID=A0ACC2AVF5_DIPCM|nr:hypothetical protein O6H91_19G059000 [Diphasiastrum complanatum]